MIEFVYHSKSNSSCSMTPLTLANFVSFVISYNKRPFNMIRGSPPPPFLPILISRNQDNDFAIERSPQKPTIWSITNQ